MHSRIDRTSRVGKSQPPVELLLRDCVEFNSSRISPRLHVIMTTSAADTPPPPQSRLTFSNCLYSKYIHIRYNILYECTTIITVCKRNS